MLGAKWFRKLDERRLGILLGAFFLALAIPAAVLIAQAYGQLKWEAFRRNQLLAEDLAARVDAGLRAEVAAEEARSFGDYSFLVVAGKDAAANFVQRSPLSAFPVEGAVPGTLGYFQVDALGNLTTPLLPGPDVDPAAYGITADEQMVRRALFASLSEVLAANRLVLRSLDASVVGNAEPSARAQAPAPASTSPPSSSAVSPAPRSSSAASSGPSPEESSATKKLNSAFAPSVAFTRDDAQKLKAQIDQAEATQAAFDRLAPSAPPLAKEMSEETKARAQAAPAPARQAASDEVAGADKREVAATTGVVAGASETQPQVEQRRKRSEQSLVPQAQPAAEREKDKDAAAGGGKTGARNEFRVQTFESEVDPLEVGLLDTGEIVMFRNVWHAGQRYIQGALIDRARFVEQAVASAYRASSLATMSDVAVTYRGRPLATLRASMRGAAYESSPVAALAGTPLHRARLSPPFGDLELAFSVNHLPSA